MTSTRVGVRVCAGVCIYKCKELCEWKILNRGKQRQYTEQSDTIEGHLWGDCVMFIFIYFFCLQFIVQRASGLSICPLNDSLQYIAARATGCKIDNRLKVLHASCEMAIE
jgi:hypothetical protein